MIVTISLNKFHTNLCFSKKKERNNIKIYLHESVRVIGNLYVVTRSNLTHANKQQKNGPARLTR